MIYLETACGGHRLWDVHGIQVITMSVAKLGRCINANCPAKFKYLGTDEMYWLPIDLPQRWELSATYGRKSCGCARAAYGPSASGLTGVHGEVLAVNKHERRAKAASGLTCQPWDVNRRGGWCPPANLVPLYLPGLGVPLRIARSPPVR